jgi:adenosine deaminase
VHATDRPRLQGRVLRSLVGSMPKAELHLHLDGALRVDTALDLARSRGIDAPGDYAGMFAALVAPDVTESQAALLDAFALPVSLMQDSEALERVTLELVQAKAADRVRYCEIRWAPMLHTARGLRLADGIRAVCQGARLGSQRTGTQVRLICVAVRSHDPADNVHLAEVASGFHDEGVVGFDLAGLEDEFPDPLAHSAAFDAARAGGLRITLHAGELHDAGAGVRRALAVDPERIAHGVGAIEDPGLCAELTAGGITLDLCPTSNVQAASVSSLGDHPVARLHRIGVPVTISTDDPTISDVTLTDEYIRAMSHTGLTASELWRINRHALAAAFLDKPAADALSAEFDHWASLIPELGPGV